MLKEELERDDYDPEDYRVGTWAYRKLRPRRPNQIVLVAVALGAYFAMKKVLEGRTLADIVSVFLWIEWRVVIVAAVACVILLCFGLCAKDRLEGVNRPLIMFSTSSIWLGLVAMVASVGHGGAAALMGTAVRVGPLAVALWYWRDLKIEIDMRQGWLVRFYRIWRRIVTAVLLVGGSLIRIIGLEGGGVEHELRRGASEVRRRLGERFPVAFSLCNDVGGFIFLACLGVGVGIIYCVYLVVYVTDLFQKRDHRKCMSIVTKFMTKRGLYQPNVHRKKKLQRLSGGETSLTPSPVMMLRANEIDAMTDSSYLSREHRMPVLSMLEKENEILRKEGLDRWMKPRGEDVPLGEGLTYEERSLQAIANWARPLTEEEDNMSFAEFFETVEDDEYRYDPESGNWVFTDLEKEDEKTREGMDKLKSTLNGTEPDFEELEKVIKDMSGMDLQDLVLSPDLDPSLREEILRFKKQNDDDNENMQYIISV